MTDPDLIAIAIGLFAHLPMAYGICRILRFDGRTGFTAFIPILNLIFLIPSVRLSKWWAVVLIVPGPNILFIAFLMFRLAIRFQRSRFFGLGLLLAPFLFFPILGAQVSSLESNYEKKSEI